MTSDEMERMYQEAYAQKAEDREMTEHNRSNLLRQRTGGGYRNRGRNNHNHNRRCKCGEANLWIRLEVRDEEDEVIQTKELDFHTPDARQNIAKTAWWAMHNGYSVETYPMDPDEVEEMQRESREAKFSGQRERR
jgi:hypothetical protein